MKIDNSCQVTVSKLTLCGNHSMVRIWIVINYYLNKPEKRIFQGYRKSTEYSVLFQTHSNNTQFITDRYMPEITAIVFELLSTGNNKLTQRKEPQYCKSWNKLDLPRKTKNNEYSVVFESEYHTTKNKFLEIGKCAKFKKFK